MTTERANEDVQPRVDAHAIRRYLKELEEQGLLKPMPTADEMMRAQGKTPIRSVEDIPRADFEYDVDEFLRLIREAPGSGRCCQ